MGRKLIAVIISCIITMVSLPVGMASAKTISNPDTIKVGLKSLQSSSLSITLEGYYKVNGTPMSDKQLTFNVKNGEIGFNGSAYNEIYLEPAVSSSKVAIINSGKTCKYSGVILLKSVGNTILPINYIDMQSYLKGVLPYEISDSYPIEAIKAQAITSRTFALANLNKHKSEGIDICDTTNCQVYKGENSSCKNISKAVDNTKNMILTYNGSLASVTFGASNGGYTESSLNIWGSNHPYLPVVEDKYDINPWPQSNIYTTAQIDNLLKCKGYINSQDKFFKIGQIVKNSSSRVSEMEVIYTDKNGKENSRLLKKEEPRAIFSLRSMLFDVIYSEKTDSYTFSGRGYGHGVGMSQLGANARAKDGQEVNQILGFYFPGTKIESVDSAQGEKPSLPPLNPDGQADPKVPSEPENSQYKIIAQNGVRGTVVKNIQTNLNYLGYNAGSSDGIFGKNTEKAVKSFQKREGYKETGVINEHTYDLLTNRVKEKKKAVGSTGSSYKVIAKYGNKGQAVKEVQTLLNKKGYSSGKVDGIFGNNTRKGVISFQRAKGLSSTGIVDNTTYNALKL